MIKKLCIVVSSPFALEMFLVPQLRALSKLYQVTVLVNTQNEKLLQILGVDAKLIPIPIERKIRPLRDVYALVLLFHVFRKGEFDLIHSVTPKAGLLSMIAAYLAKTPIRIHTFTGQVWGTQSGINRWILKTADKVTAFLASVILVDSTSQRDFIVKENVLPDAKAFVLANGSISGVNVERFRPNSDYRRKVRNAHGIPMNSFVILYMSRLTRDKGAIVMAEAFAAFASANLESQLIVVGPDEEALRPQIRKLCRDCLDRVHFVDLVHVPEEYMACADVFCLPSYREGFGSAYLNAAAVGIPAIASRIYGSSDAVVDGETGFLFEAGNVGELVALLSRLQDEPALRASMGRRARTRVTAEFSEELLTSALLAFYEKKLTAAN